MDPDNSSSQNINLPSTNDPTEENTTVNLNVASGSTSIYEGGFLTQIKISDLLNNSTAISQLVNEYNLKNVELQRKDAELSLLKEKTNAEIAQLKSNYEFLRTTPAISIFTSLMTVIGTVLVGFATNIMTNTAGNSNNYASIFLTSGIAVIIISQALNIFHPFIKSWFNKKNK